MQALFYVLVAIICIMLFGMFATLASSCFRSFYELYQTRRPNYNDLLFGLFFTVLTLFVGWGFIVCLHEAFKLVGLLDALNKVKP